MKTINVFLMGFIILMISCSENSEDVTSRNPQFIVENENSAAKVGQTGVIPLARFNSNQQRWVLNTDRLVKNFEDGGKIKYFALRKSGSKFGFMRIGYDALGNHRTESFQTVVGNGKMGLKLTNELVWFVVCSGSCSFCTPNSNGTSCECPGGSSEMADLDAYEDTGLVVDLDDIFGSSDGLGNCDFGGPGGGSFGIYPTQVLN